MRSAVTGSTLALLAVGVSVTLGFMVHAGAPARPAWWLLFVPFAAWGIAPYAAVAVAARRARGSRAPAWVLFLAAALLVASSAALLYDAFVRHLDPQSGLVFLFLPLLQVAGLAPFLLFARALRRKADVANGGRAPGAGGDPRPTGDRRAG
jgi:hypothetical protein